MSPAAERRLRGLAAFVGVCLSVGYWVWQYLEPHGPHEFAYAPFNVEPMPYSPMRGFTYEQLWGHVRRALLLGPGLLLLVWGLSVWVKLRPPRDLRRAARLACGLSLVATAFVMLVLLRGRAITDDELAYSMQATFFRAGRLTGPDLGLDPLDFFNVATPGGYTIKYLPGEPLLQVLGTLVGVPALLHLPVVGFTLLAWYHTLRRSSGERIALFGTMALGCSPMLIFTSATGLSHATSLLCVVLMGLGVEQVRAGQGLAGAALSGLSFAAGMLTRPQSMLPVAAVLGVALLAALFRTRAYRGLMVLVLTAGAGLALLLAYNRLITGSAFRLPWSQECDAAHFGFGRIWALSTYEHTLTTALQNLGVVALRLNSWWLGLPLSLAVPVGFVLLRARAQGAALWLWTGLAVLAFQFFYYSPGVSDTGAVYHYELLLPGSVMVAHVADALLTRFSSFGPLALLLGLVLGTGSWIAEQGLRVQRLVSLIHHESDRALEQISAPALLVHERLERESVGRGWVFQ